MKKVILAVSLAATVVLNLAGTVNAVVLTFDDITTDTNVNVPMPDGYGGLNWNQVNLNDRAHGGHISHGIVSGDYAARTAADFIGEVTTPFGTFDFVSVYMAAAWLGSVELDVNGYLGPDKVYSTRVSVPYSPPTLYEFNYDGIDRLEFISFPGPGPNLDVIVDDLTLEPGNLPPGANAGPDLDTLVGVDVSFDAGDSIDPDGSIVQYSWDFGDGTPVIDEADPVVVHTYLETGVYMVTLTVEDNVGATDDDTAVCVVMSAAEGARDLLEEMEELDLPRGTASSLASKLETAITSLETGNREAAARKLAALINSVEAQRGKKLTEEEADLLIDYTADIMASAAQ